MLYAAAVHFAPPMDFGWTMLMVAVTFIVLYLIVKKYFFEKVRAFMLAREQKVKDSFENADEANRLASEKLSAYTKQLEQAEIERREILKDGKKKADKLASEIIKEAEGKAGEIMKRAEAEIEKEKTAAIENMREQISFLAVFAAEKIIGRNLDEAGQQAIIDGVIEEASGIEQGESAWKS